MMEEKTVKGEREGESWRKEGKRKGWRRKEDKMTTLVDDADAPSS